MEATKKNPFERISFNLFFDVYFLAELIIVLPEHMCTLNENSLYVLNLTEWQG